jgi:hypothetical protein
MRLEAPPYGQVCRSRTLRLSREGRLYPAMNVLVNLEIPERHLLRLTMTHSLFWAAVSTNHPSDLKTAHPPFRVSPLAHINRCQKRHSAFGRLKNISYVSQATSTELSNNDLMILLISMEIAETVGKKGSFHTAALSVAPQCASRIARPNALASQVTDDTFLSSSQSHNLRKRGYPPKHGSKRQQSRAVYFCPTRAFVLPLLPLV